MLHFSTKYKSMYTTYIFTWGQISLKNKSFTTFQRTLNHCRKRNLGLRCQSFCTVGNFSGFLGFIFCKELFIFASKFVYKNNFTIKIFFLENWKFIVRSARELIWQVYLSGISDFASFATNQILWTIEKKINTIR